MSLFKKISSTPTSANIQATVLPVASGLDPRAETQTYMVSIESNNADLINENVNSIELSSETKPVNVATSALAPNISGGELTNIVKASNTHSSSPKARSVGSIDPKMTVSHGDLGLSNSKPISDNIIRENIIFSERRMSEVPAHSITAAEVAKGNIHFNNANVSFTALRDTTLSGVLSPGDTFKSSGHFSPIVKKRTSATIPKKTTTISKIKVRKNEQIKVNLRSASGKLIGRAGNSAKNIQPNLETQDQQTLLKPFRLLSSNPEPFKINTSQNEDGFHLHVVSRFP